MPFIKNIKFAPYQFWMIHLLIFLVYWTVNILLMTTGHYNIDTTKVVGNNIVDAFYLTITTHTTTGYGDISPKSHLSKFLVASHQLLVYLLTAGFLVINATSNGE